MFKISKLADYAVVIMQALARKSGQCCSARLLSEQTGISVPTVGKILKLLLEKELLESSRGPSGGYCLVKSPESITVATMVAAIDGEPAITECSQELAGCQKAACCGAQQCWQEINQKMVAVLNGYSLADFLKRSERPIVLHGRVKEVVNE